MVQEWRCMRMYFIRLSLGRHYAEKKAREVSDIGETGGSTALRLGEWMRGDHWGQRACSMQGAGRL
ncbi:hypothetical protein PLEOSDRAFT_1071076 [Pleurotus ostreatus PC15]|uniref:Uncharacterized protein n=1 Tax=Pleurotus ostreatus (strain PC15) TaxID=1137138 RepID=A0A067NT31_PLEO1|nr:hypothetical protein PLEOSDRAFT_1071076 [Pleurotus ostreatus PC15]